MMETMIPPQVGMILRMKEKRPKRAQQKKKKKRENKKDEMREKERRGNATILYHTCALE